jgi:hypothetical protein
MKRLLLALLATLTLAAGAAGRAQGEVGTAFPLGFPVLVDHSLKSR